MIRMSQIRSTVQLPIVHGLVIAYLFALTVIYSYGFSETFFGAPVTLVAVLLYLAYLLYRAVLALERIADDVSQPPAPEQ